MSGQWAGSTRAHRLPRDWAARCAFVWARDGDLCWLCGGSGATEVDHKDPGDDHDVGNLGPVHTQCHRVKSSAEGSAARWQYRRGREPERHPGYL